MCTSKGEKVNYKINRGSKVCYVKKVKKVCVDFRNGNLKDKCTYPF